MARAVGSNGSTVIVLMSGAFVVVVPLSSFANGHDGFYAWLRFDAGVQLVEIQIAAIELTKAGVTDEMINDRF